MNEIITNVPDYCVNCPEMELMVEMDIEYNDELGFSQRHYVQCEHLIKCSHLRKYFKDLKVVK